MTQPPATPGPAMPGPGTPGGAIPGRLKRVSRAWGWLLLALSILTLGLRGYLLQRLHDGVVTVWQVTWLTLPMVAAVTILVYRWRTRQPITPVTFFGILIGTLAASWVTGISSGERVAEVLYPVNIDCLVHNTCSAAAPANPISLTFRVIGTYFSVFGPTGFVSALVVGAFFGYAFAVLSGRDRSGQPAPPAGTR